jgi:hypothetical protein
MHRICFFLLLFSLSTSAFCQPTNLRLYAGISQHDKQFYSKVLRTEQALLTDENMPASIHIGGAVWQVSLSKSVVAGRPEASDLRFSFTLLKGNSPQTKLLATLQFDDWSAENYVCMPAAAYNGNRFESRRIAYSPKLLDPKDIGKDKPTIISDVPRLNIKNGPSYIYERTGGMSVPSIGFYNSKGQYHFWLLTRQETRLGDGGIEIEESADRKSARISITAPVVRPLYKYRITDNQYPSDDVGADFSEGDTLTIFLRVYIQSSNRLQNLFDHFCTIRKDLYPKASSNNFLGFSSAFVVQERKFNTQNFVPEHGYYAVGMRENFLQDWQIGWTGGMITTLPLLALGSKESVLNVVRNFDWLFANGIAPTGFFWDSGEKGTIWYGGDIRKPTSQHWHLVRKGGDGLYFVLQQLELMPLRGVQVKPLWETGTRRVADAFAQVWEVNGQFGNFIDSRTGDIAVGGSASGAILPAAMMKAAHYFKSDRYKRVALESGEYFYQTFTQKGITTGGPGDAMQNPDSESAYALVESFTQLYLYTKDTKWLRYAEEAAKQFATWVQGYDYRFPPQSLFGRIGIKATGAVWANTQNKHGAPGICTFSGVALLHLYEATGNDFYKQLLYDIAHNMTQYIGHPARPIEGVKDGWMCERVSTTDWNEGIGEITYMSTWAETSLMLTYLEVPGLYIEPDKKQVTMFDHLDVLKTKFLGKNVWITVKNNTKAAVSVRYRVKGKSRMETLPEVGIDQTAKFKISLY